MRRQVQIELVREVLAHAAAGTTCLADGIATTEVAAYTSASRLECEQSILFRGQPQFIGLSAQIPRPGDYLADERGAAPILVVRANDGTLDAFLNVCRHRGARLACGSGRLHGRITCPYHGWSYHLDGRLAGIPDESSFAGIDRERHALTPLAVAEHGGLVWVHPTPGATLDVESHLGPLADEIASYRFEGYHHYANRVLHHRMNWKMAIDTFLEPYHFAVLHARTVAPIFIPNLCLHHGFGLHLRETLPRRSILALDERPEAEWDLVTHSALVYVLFPNTVLVMQGDHLETWRVFPHAGRADECEVVLDLYTPEPADTESARGHWDRNLDLVLRTVIEEDFPMCEGIQAGLASGAQSHVTLGRNEPSLQHWHRAFQSMAGG